MASVTIRVNDEPRSLAEATTLETLVRDLGLAGRKGVALAVNQSVVPRTAWVTRTLTDGDRVIVIRATQGG